MPFSRFDLLPKGWRIGHHWEYKGFVPTVDHCLFKWAIPSLFFVYFMSSQSTMKHFYSKNVKKIHSNSQPLWRINCWQNLNQISPTAWTGSKHMTLWEGVTKMTCIRTLFSEIFFNLANLSPFSIFCPISQFNDTF